MGCTCKCGCKNRVTYSGQIAGGCPSNEHLTKVQKREHNNKFFPVNYNTKQAKSNAKSNANRCQAAADMKTILAGAPEMLEDGLRVALKEKGHSPASINTCWSIAKSTAKSNANKCQAATAAKTILTASPGLTDAVLTAALEELGHSSASINSYKSAAKSSANASAKLNEQIVEQMKKCGEDLPNGSSRTGGNAVSLGLAQAGKLFNSLSNNFGAQNNHISHGMCGKHNRMLKPKVTINLETVIIDKTMLNREVWKGLFEHTLVDPNTGKKLSSKMKKFVKEISVVGVSSGGDNVVTCNAAEGELGRLALDFGFKVGCNSDMAAKGMSMGGAHNYFMRNGEIWNNNEEIRQQMRDDRKLRKIAFKDEYAENIVPGPQVVGLIILPIDESKYMLRKDWNKRPAENDTDEDDRMENPKRRRISESSDESGDEC